MNFESKHTLHNQYSDQEGKKGRREGEGENVI